MYIHTYIYTYGVLGISLYDLFSLKFWLIVDQKVFTGACVFTGIPVLAVNEWELKGMSVEGQFIGGHQ